jgi:hypothetical protein
MPKPPWRYGSDPDEPEKESVTEADSFEADEDLTEQPPPVDAPWVFKKLEPIGPDYDDTVLIEYKQSGRRARVGPRVAAELVSRGRAKRL